MARDHEQDGGWNTLSTLPKVVLRARETVLQAARGGLQTPLPATDNVEKEQWFV